MFMKKNGRRKFFWKKKSTTLRCQKSKFPKFTLFDKTFSWRLLQSIEINEMKLNWIEFKFLMSSFMNHTKITVYWLKLIICLMKDDILEMHKYFSVSYPFSIWYFYIFFWISLQGSSAFADFCVAGFTIRKIFRTILWKKKNLVCRSNHYLLVLN